VYCDTQCIAVAEIMRILAIDDDPAMLELLRSLLVSNGYACLTASGAEEALRLITVNPDVLLAISDIDMPGMDGITFLERINSRCRPGAAPRVVFLTAHPRIDYAVSALRLGAIDFLTKPVRPQNMMNVIRSAIERVRSERAMSVLPDQVAMLARQAQELAAIAGTGAGARAAGPQHYSSPERESAGGQAGSLALLGTNHLRRLRREFPLLGDLDDVAWDLLRELFRAESSGERLSVSSLSLAVEQVSPSTAMRRIQKLAGSGLIVRSLDPTDARRDFVALAANTRSALEGYLERVAKEFAAGAGSGRQA
jgi:CheY-like chemotaxis protein/DNA-binding MarR family transcriptional regulator